MDTSNMNSIAPAWILAALLSVGGCLSDSSGNDSFVDPGPGNPGNRVPTITGAPGSAVTIGDTYSFTPSANDPDGDSLSFAIANPPGWASFNAGNGALTGTPTLGDLGTYNNIVITVSDGSADASLGPFSVTVTDSATGSVTLSWTAPTQNSDGSTMTDLAGYKLYYGDAPGNYTNQLTISNPGTTMYVVENLVPDTYYFVATAINTGGVESAFSNVASRTVNP